MKYSKSQAYFTIYFDSDFEPSVLNKILGVNAKKIVMKKDAVRNLNNPKQFCFYQLATNVADDRETEMAVVTILRHFIGKEEQILKLIKDNNGYCQLDLYVKREGGVNPPQISLSPNAIKVLSKLDAIYNVILI